MSAFILVVEDDQTLAKNIRLYLGRYGYQVKTVSTGTDALASLERLHPDIALVDLNLPDMGGIELLMRIRSLEPHTVVIMMTGAGSVQAAVDAMKAGAQDYLPKPIVLKELKLLLDKTLKAQGQSSALSYYHDRVASQSGLEKIIGDSVEMRETRQRIAQFIAAEKQLDGQEPPTVLITGETGTGKELVSSAFHFEGPRRDKPFVEINCASIPANLLEAELFGYERGAFTDAKQRKIGLIDAANGGTLFLDELGEMELSLQAKLLTLIENRRLRRLGSVQEHEVDVRIIAATNQDLEQLVAAGRFRSDLFYRLRVIHVHIPPLRERGHDIELLANTFLAHHASRYRRGGIRFSRSALDRLLAHSWPGNVRELRNTIEQAVLLCSGDIIDPEHLLITHSESSASAAGSVNTPSLNVRNTEILLIESALEKTQGNITRAAALLGMSRDTLRYRLNKYKLRVED